MKQFKKIKNDKKLFVVRKYVWAKDINDVLHIEKKQSVDDVWIDDEWKKNSQDPKDAIGFYVEKQDEAI